MLFHSGKSIIGRSDREQQAFGSHVLQRLRCALTPAFGGKWHCGGYKAIRERHEAIRAIAQRPAAIPTTMLKPMSNRITKCSAIENVG
jgi:hypothetical protein